MADIGLVLLSPLTVLITILIRLESEGSPIFIQRRVGEGGREFNMHKFRSMIKDADDVSSTNAKFSYDLYYIKNLSLMMNFVIFFKTIKIIFTGFGVR